MTSVFDLPSPARGRRPLEQAALAQARNPTGETARNEARREADREAEQRKANTTVGDLIGAHAATGGIGFLHRLAQESQMPVDPEWKFPENFREDMEAANINPAQWELFEKAHSEEHYVFLKFTAMQNQMAAEDKGQFGVLANLAAGMTDPIAFGLDAATGGLAIGARAGRLANAARAGAAAAGTNIALTGMTAAYDPEVGLGDFAIAAGAGLVMGGALGARRGDLWEPAKVEALAKSDVTGSPQSMGAARLAGLPENPTPGLKARTLTDAMEEHVANGVDGVHIEPAFAPVRRSLSARFGKLKDPTARGVGRWLFRDGVGYTDRNLAVKQSAIEKASLDRQTTESKFHRTWNVAWEAARDARKVPMMELRAAELKFNDEVGVALRGVPSNDPHVNAAAAAARDYFDESWAIAERAGLVEPGMKADDYFPQIQSPAAYQRIFGEKGIDEDTAVEVYTQSILSKMRQEANPDALKKYQELEAAYKGTSDAALRTRERADDLGKDIGPRQQAVRDAEARVAEVKDVPGKQGGRMRTAAARRLADAQRKLQRAGTRRDEAAARLKTALEKEQAAGYAAKQARAVADDAGVNEELARAYAKALINRGKGKLDPAKGGAIRPLDTSDLDALREVLEEAGASTERIVSILGKYTREATEGSKMSAAHKRIRLDPSFRMTVKNRFGEDVELGVTDFMENDAMRVALQSNREMIGWSALASHGNVRTPAELKALKDLLLRGGKDAGDNIKDTERMFDIGISSVFGRSTEADPTSSAARLGRAARDTQFIRVMNQVGFTLFTELGPVLAHGGILNVLRSIPELPAMLKRAQDGTLKNGEARLLEDWIATGTEHLRNPAFLRVEDDAFLPSVYGDSRFGRAMENGTMLAQRFTSIASGMAPLNTAMQRLAGRAMLMKLLQLANQKRPLSEGMIRRLRSNGLDQETQDALFGALKGIKRVEDITENSLPLAQREAAAAWLFRTTRHAVLEGDVSDSIQLMHGTVGKILMQFRSFMAYSYERHFLNSIYHWKDFNTYMMVALSTSLAGIQWTARTYLNTAGDEEKRQQLMTQGNFAKAAVANSSWGAVVPAITDSILPFLGEEPQFQNTRSTGMASDFLRGIPVVDHATKIGAAMSIPSKALRSDQEVETRDLQNLSKIFWFQNLTGWQNIQNLAIKQAEESGLVTETSKKNNDLAAERKKDRELSWRSKYLFDITPGD